jgi:two-component system osmolarity sensor histidine kinase EnvZ
MPRTLFARSLLIVVAPVMILYVVMGYIFLNQHWEEVTRQLSNAVARDIAFVIELETAQPNVDPTPTLQLASDALGTKFEYLPHEEMNDDKGQQNVQQRPPGRVVRMKEDKDRQNVLSRMMGKAVKRRLSYPSHVQLAPDGENYEVDVETPRGLLRVTVPEKRIFTVTTFQFIFWFTGIAAALLFIAILFLRGQVRPISRLAEAAEAFGNGIDRPFRVEGAREVRRAAAAFLLMRERIRRQIAQRTEMLAGVSHDLRTPLTRMKLQLALMKDTGIEELKSDVAEMEAMIEAYLQFARGEGEETPVSIQLDELLNQLVKDTARGQEGKISLKTAPVKLNLRPQATRRALGNIIQNALNYGDHCDVTVEETEDNVIILIDDNGPGIPEYAREDVFRPFYRLEQSRNRASGGIGLGLAIARDIVRTHGGEVTLETSPVGGLRVKVQLPK